MAVWVEFLGDERECGGVFWRFLFLESCVFERLGMGRVFWRWVLRCLADLGFWFGHGFGEVIWEVGELWGCICIKHGSFGLCKFRFFFY